jgi:acyl-CoA synthetase (AMP-forming)/AMP-acid ligase II
MCFTSGTTGNPKGVLHCFNTTLCTCEIFNRELAVSDKDVMLDYLPVGLNWGSMTLVQAAMAGARVVLMERFSVDTALELIERERVTYIPTAPASIIAMLNSPQLAQRDLSSLRIVITGGASAAVETIKAFQAAVPQAKLIELYGMLETGYHSFTRLTDDPLKVNGTVGHCVEEMGLRILEDDGNDVPYGEVGEIVAMGPSLHMGYLDNPPANRDSFTTEGWFRTGDLGQYADKQGNVRITGRKKEIINRGGKKYFPREIEELLYQHPKIMQAAIVGTPDARLGEKNCLCVMLKPGSDLTLEEVVSFLRGRVADYKLPEELVVMNDFPMTPTGKIRRPELVKRVAGTLKTG